jgi:hypothetical protein
VVLLQFMESRVNSGFRCPDAKWQLFIVSFDESGLVWFRPNIVGVHRPFFLGIETPLASADRAVVKQLPGLPARSSVFARNRRPEGAAERWEKQRFILSTSDARVLFAIAQSGTLFLSKPVRGISAGVMPHFWPGDKHGIAFRAPHLSEAHSLHFIRRDRISTIQA